MTSPTFVERLCKSVVSLIPQWYMADVGPKEHRLDVGDYSQRFFSTRSLTPLLDRFLTMIRQELSALAESPLAETPSFLDVVQESFAIKWLEEHSNTINWRKVVRYAGEVTERTFEISPVSVNLILSDGRYRRCDASQVSKIL